MQEPKAEKYCHQSLYAYSGNNPVLYKDFDGNDYGVTIDRGNHTITISASVITNSRNAAAFNTFGRDAWNSQSGKFVFVAGGVKALKEGNAETYKVNINNYIRG